MENLERNGIAMKYYNCSIFLFELKMRIRELDLFIGISFHFQFSIYAEKESNLHQWTKDLGVIESPP